MARFSCAHVQCGGRQRSWLRGSRYPSVEGSKWAILWLPCLAEVDLVRKRIPALQERATLLQRREEEEHRPRLHQPAPGFGTRSAHLPTRPGEHLDDRQRSLTFNPVVNHHYIPLPRPPPRIQLTVATFGANLPRGIPHLVQQMVVAVDLASAAAAVQQRERRERRMHVGWSANVQRGSGEQS